MPYPPTTGPAGYAAAGAADQQALKELTYKRYLEHIAGFAPGESDLPDEEILRRRAMASGAARPAGAANPASPDAPQRAAMTQVPFDAVLSQLKMRPGMVEHLEGIDLDGDGVPDIPPGPPPMDPAGRMRWQAMMAERQRRMQATQMRRTQRKEVNNQVLLAVLQANDPLYGITYNRLTSYIQQLPDKVRRPYLEAVDRTPGAFLDLYVHLRNGVERALKSSSSVSKASMPQPGSNDPRARIRQAVAGRMSPPALENAGILEDRLPGASRAAELAALKARCKAGQAREGDLLRYLELNWNGGFDR